jgi:hypothetical protein
MPDIQKNTWRTCWQDGMKICVLAKWAKCLDIFILNSLFLVSAQNETYARTDYAKGNLVSWQLWYPNWQIYHLLAVQQLIFCTYTPWSWTLGCSYCKIYEKGKRTKWKKKEDRGKTKIASFNQTKTRSWLHCKKRFKMSTSTWGRLHVAHQCLILLFITSWD